MFPHILFLIDFSEQGRALNRPVEWLANRFHSQVTLLHVVEVPATWYGAYGCSPVSEPCFASMMDAAKQQLKEYSIHLPASQVQRVLVQGNTALQITKWAEEHAVDLIVMGTHGHGPVRDSLLGSVAAKVLHDVDCPVWSDARGHTPASEQQAAVSNLVCAIELTDEAIPLLQFTAQLAGELSATVHVVHSVPDIGAQPDPFGNVDLHPHLVESARAEMTKLQQNAGTDFPLSISSARIPQAIAEVARQQRAHLVVMGRGKSREAWGRLRTHAYDIIRQAPCPALSYCLGQQTRIASSPTAMHSAQPAGEGPLPVDS